CTALILHLLEGDCSRDLVPLIEQWADEPAVGADVQSAVARNYQFLRTLPPYSAERWAAGSVNSAAGPAAWAAAWQVTLEVRQALLASGRAPVQSPPAQQAALLRHIIGNPVVPPVFDPAWRTPGT